jgi:NAD(P)-dependent dehydrogenase (short-subunit alcohol dehydrogenase family)
MAIPEPPPLGTAMLPRDTYAGEVVVVTGGGMGLGKAIAVEFGRVGAAVAIVSRSAEHRARGVEAVEATGARALGVEMDVREPEQIAAAFDTIEGQLGSVGVLVHNAAGNFPVAAEALSPRGWRSVTDIVLNGTFNNIGATYAWTGGPCAAHSAVAKAGVVNMTMTLAVERAPYGIP